MPRYYLYNDSRYYYFQAIKDAVRRGGGKQIREARQHHKDPVLNAMTVVTWSLDITQGGITVAFKAIEDELRMLYPYVNQGHGLPNIKEKDW